MGQSDSHLSPIRHFASSLLPHSSFSLSLFFLLFSLRQNRFLANTQLFKSLHYKIQSAWSFFLLIPFFFLPISPTLLPPPLPMSSTLRPSCFRSILPVLQYRQKCAIKEFFPTFHFPYRLPSFSFCKRKFVC